MEREEKRLAKVKEKEIKTAERRSKAEEKKRIAELKKNEQVEKCKQREERLERLDRSADDTGIQTDEISNSECAACFGLYDEDLLFTGELVQDWVECTQCKRWMHSQSVQLDGQDLLACCVCGSVFQ